MCTILISTKLLRNQGVSFGALCNVSTMGRCLFRSVYTRVIIIRKKASRREYSLAQPIYPGTATTATIRRNAVKRYVQLLPAPHLPPPVTSSLSVVNEV